MKPTHHKKYYIDIEKDLIKYGDEGIKYRAKLPSKISHKINHKIPHSDKEIKEIKEKEKDYSSYLEPFKSKGRHHEQEHTNNLLDKVLDKQQDKEEQKDKARKGLVPLFGNGIIKPTHNDVTPYERELAILNEASMKHGHDTTQKEIQEYLRDMGVKKYNIDFENSTSDVLVFVNKQTGNATLSFRGSSLSKHAKSDWSSNAEIGAKKTLDTNAHKKIDTFYNRVKNIYDVEHVTGYSRGGHFATFLANKYDINSTTFNPFISASNIINAKKGGNAKHLIINTTEDVVSVLAPIYELNNPNQVQVKTLLPTADNASIIDPISGHNNTNFLNERKLPRSSGKRIELQEKIVSNGKKIGELEMVRLGKIIKDNGGTLTDFLKRINPNDIIESRSLVDGSKTIEFSDRIKGGGAEVKIWNELGGEITRLENLKLSQNISIDPVEFETTALERIDHANAPQHIRQKNINFLQDQLKNTTNELNTNINNSSGRLTEISKAGFKSVISMGAGAFVGYELEENVNKQLGEASVGVVANIFQPKKMLRGGIGSLASAELADAVSGLIDDKPTANVVNSAINLGSLPVTEAIGEFALGRIASTALGVAVAPFVAPELALVGGLTLAGAGLGLIGNYFLGNKPEENKPEENKE